MSARVCALPLCCCAIAHAAVADKDFTGDSGTGRDEYGRKQSNNEARETLKRLYRLKKADMQQLIGDDSSSGSQVQCDCLD